MVNLVHRRITKFLDKLRLINLFDFNKFIIKNIIYHMFKTRNILPFIIAATVIGFSVITEESRYIFIPQTSLTAYASFFIFTLIMSIITLLIYPIFIIIIVNFITGYIKGTTVFKYSIKFSILLASFIIGIAFFTRNSVDTLGKIQIIIIWVGLYITLGSMYIAHLTHNDLFRLSKLKFGFIAFVCLLTAKPLLLIDLHTSEALNFTNINPQVYLTAQNCELLHNLGGRKLIIESNSTLSDINYYRELPNNQGCYIYGNIIRYSFGYDYVLMVKKNINPMKNKRNLEYNEYVRLNCFAGNCYSEDHIFFLQTEDLYEAMLKTGQKLDEPI